MEYTDIITILFFINNLVFHFSQFAHSKTDLKKGAYYV